MGAVEPGSWRWPVEGPKRIVVGIALLDEEAKVETTLGPACCRCHDAATKNRL